MAPASDDALGGPPRGMLKYGGSGGLGGGGLGGSGGDGGGPGGGGLGGGGGDGGGSGAKGPHTGSCCDNVVHRVSAAVVHPAQPTELSASEHRPLALKNLSVVVQAKSARACRRPHEPEEVCERPDTSGRLSIAVGSVPLSMLLASVRIDRLVSAAKLFGTEPDSWLLCRYSEPMFVRAERDAGMMPVSAFPYSLILPTWVSVLSDGGSVPDML